MRADMAFFFIVRIVCLLLLLTVAVLQSVRLHWGRESVEFGCPAAVCLDGWLAGGRRPVKAVPVVYSRFAALCGPFPLSTPSEGVGFSAVFATPSEGVEGYIRGLLRSVALSGFLLLPKGSGFGPFSLLLPKE